MIKVEWFDKVLAMAGVNLVNRDHGEICRELSERDEVLPFVIAENGFADWPLARSALRNAAGAAKSPRSPRPESEYVSHPRTSRKYIREMMYALVNARSTTRSREWNTPSGPAGDDVTTQFKLIRSYADSDRTDPGAFIDFD